MFNKTLCHSQEMMTALLDFNMRFILKERIYTMIEEKENELILQQLLLNY